jgi:hypothetical protein
MLFYFESGWQIGGNTMDLIGCFLALLLRMMETFMLLHH